jgi:hypothetical protein
MKWSWWRTPDLAGNIRALLFVAVILGSAAAVLFFYPLDPRRNPTSSNFGPEWQCTPQILGEPTCIKKAGR